MSAELLLTCGDKEHLFDCWAEETQAPWVWDGSTPVVTSIGYVDLNPDGSVWGYGQRLGSVHDWAADILQSSPDYPRD